MATFKFRAHNMYVELKDVEFRVYEKTELVRHQMVNLGQLGEVSGIIVRGHVTNRLFQYYNTDHMTPGTKYTVPWILRKHFEAGEYEDCTCG